MAEICIAVHDKMLAAALSVPRVLRPLGPQQTLQARDYWHQAGSAYYPAWYFFGCRLKGVEGLVTMYARQGLDVWLTPVSLLSPELHFTFFDVQFCTLPFALYQSYHRQGSIIFGYLPAIFSCKKYQAEHIKNSGISHFLPAQIVYNRNSRPLLPPETGEIMILKATHGSAGRNSSGGHYTVWEKEALSRSLSGILASLTENEEIICSEFVLTNDPYAEGADHVVHKIHLICPENDEPSVYGSACQRFIYFCNRQKLAAHGSLSLPEFIGTPRITTGQTNEISRLTQLTDALKFYNSRLIFSVDFIIPPDGVPRFLESNKLAATFAERFDPSLDPVIDAYAKLPI